MVVKLWNQEKCPQELKSFFCFVCLFEISSFLFCLPTPFFFLQTGVSNLLNLYLSPDEGTIDDMLLQGKYETWQ